MVTDIKSFFNHLAVCWRGYFSIAVILLLSPFLIFGYDDPKCRCAFVVLLMTIYWAIQPIPMGVTSLFPVFLLPILELATSEEACRPYLQEANMVFVGSLIFAAAIESSNLHRRIALFVLKSIGSRLEMIMLGFMGITMFIAWWITNTATTALMLPIMDAVIQEIQPKEIDHWSDPMKKLENKKTENINNNDNNNNSNRNNHNDKNNNFNNDTNNNNQHHHNDSDHHQSSRNGHCLVTVNSNKRESIELTIRRDEKDQQLSSKCSRNDSHVHANASNGANKYSDSPNSLQSDVNFSQLRKILYISISSSANVGTTSTLTSAGPNLVLSYVLEEWYHERTSVDYLNWLMFAAPGSLLTIILNWTIFKYLYLRKHKISKTNKKANNILQEKYKQLGSLRFHEFAVVVLFVTLVLLWMFRDPQYLRGWSTIFPEKYRPRDAAVVIFMVAVLFFTPSRPLGPYPSPGLLEWPKVQNKLVWSVILLRGGGYAVAKATQTSGLSEYLGNMFTKINDLPVVMLVIIFAAIAAILTEFASNSTTATIVLPVVAQVASSIGINPLVFLIPVTMACSMCFILPAGTPANALVYEHAGLKPSDMVIPGLLMKITSLAVIVANLNLLGYPIFGLSTTPKWASLSANSTLIS
ncbi:Na(+)/citrate cotransporter-like [Panonychus citri]|uniref:Na(+)/citrate cotransporter-like n=1 Tax=Panonychus citri TaxID=50023 RepID=UPI002307B4BA|nr:Na(+)/citrate cotransporter-like [Panonychus citri]